MSTFERRSIPLCVAALLLVAGAAFAGDGQIAFNRDIRPILSENCFACHGPDENHREAELRLDDFEAAVEHGAIVPGDADASPLIERILSDSDDSVMPPPSTSKQLTSQQKDLLRRWIQQGAKYEGHWAFESIPAAVSVPPANDAWPRNPIDHFVAQSHRDHSLTHAPEADRATWLRRVTFDLTGLPPTLDELDAFLQDNSPSAYETVVQRLLTSSSYAERMTTMWLDVARYADTFGYQSDVELKMWPWRDWVIRAFQTNMPYDQFVTEQIAGDLLPDATVDQRLATGFNRLHRQTNEGGSIPEEFRITGIADRTTTAGTAFLALTFECCRCHDHKFDPLKQRDFYRLAAYFSDIDEFGVYAHFTQGVPTPALLLYEGDQRAQHDQAQQRVGEAATKLAAVMAERRAYWSAHPDQLLTHLPLAREPVYSNPLEGTVDGVVGKATVCTGDDEIRCNEAPQFGRTSPFSYSLWINPAIQQPRMLVMHQSRAPEDSAFRGIQLTIDDGHPEFSMIHFWPGNALRIRTKGTIPTGQWTHIAVTHDGSGKAAGVQLYVNGNVADVDVVRDKLTRDVRHRGEWGDADVGGVRLTLAARFRDVGFRDGKVDDLRVYDVPLSSLEVASIYHAVRSADPSPNEVGNGIDRDAAIEHQLMVSDEAVKGARDELQGARNAEDVIMTQVREIMTMRHYDDAPATHILQRGEYTSLGEKVTAGTPRFGELQVEGQNRLALARWLTDPSHPLTSRVIVNRMWHLFFGRGIVVTLEDFGSQGTPPSHPELLDYLSRSLIDHHWDLHWLCREIVLSATYRQSSAIHDSAGYQQDPDNEWLARGPKHRLAAEQLRDAVLSSSGLLVNKLGGPSVMPYQPPGLWEEAGTGKSYHQSTGEGLYRRSMYTFWRRTAPPPSMITFDATNRETCTARRELTTTPLQALVFLNDPQFVEASRVMAAELLKNHPDDSHARWNELFRRLLSRMPTERELKVIQQSYHEQVAYFQSDTSRADEFLKVGTQAVEESLDRIDLAATTIVVQTLFAYDETIMLR